MMSDAEFENELKQLCAKYGDRKAVRSGNTWVVTKIRINPRDLLDSDESSSDSDDSDTADEHSLMRVCRCSDETLIQEQTRPDTRLPKSRAGGQGPYLRSSDHLSRSSEVKEMKS